MIGVFDSGIGGLTLLNEIRKHLPNEDFIYFADTKNVPYSYKTPEQIKYFVEEAVVFLLQKGCKAIVLACNTATNVAVEYLRSKYTVPFIAIQPAVKVAIDNNKENKRIIACATPVTIRSERFKNLVSSLDVEQKIDFLPLPKLVEFAENEIFEGEEVSAYLKDEFSVFDLKQYKYLVMGCTHFTFFEDVFPQLAPNLVPVDGNFGTARHLKNVLFQLHLLDTKQAQGTIEFYESGIKVEDTRRFDRYLTRISQQSRNAEMPLS